MESDNEVYDHFDEHSYGGEDVDADDVGYHTGGTARLFESEVESIGAPTPRSTKSYSSSNPPLTTASKSKPKILPKPTAKSKPKSNVRPENDGEGHESDTSFSEGEDST
jgi:hypothetical protein